MMESEPWIWNFVGLHCPSKTSGFEVVLQEVSILPLPKKHSSMAVDFEICFACPFKDANIWFAGFCTHIKKHTTFRWLPPIEALHGGIESTWSGTGLRGTPRVYLENFHWAILDDFRVWYFCIANGMDSVYHLKPLIFWFSKRSKHSICF